MMRKLTVFLSWLLVLVLTGPQVWGKPAGLAALDKQVERQVVQAQAKAKPTAKGTRPTAKQKKAALTARQQQITQALDKVRLKPDDPNLIKHIVPWEVFWNRNQVETGRNQERLNTYNQFRQEAEQLGEKEGEQLLTSGVYTIGSERPDYGKETKGVPFIYVTDASGHGTQSIVSEVREVMRSVRAANPQARILLALEFAVMIDFNTPIRFAGKPNEAITILKQYDQLVASADQWKMDILALDDAIVWPWEGRTGWKIGDQLLFIPTPYEQVVKPDEFEQLLGVIAASTYGIILRNEQWTSYLRAAKPFYDIVIVYGGNGHIDSPVLPFLDVPVQLGEKHALFNFYTAERNQKEDKFLDNTYKMLCSANACVQVPVGQMPDETQPREDEEELKSIVYEKIDVHAFNTYIDALAADKQAHYKDLKERMKKAGFKDVSPEAMFDVYLPDATK